MEEDTAPKAEATNIQPASGFDNNPDHTSGSQSRIPSHSILLLLLLILLIIVPSYFLYREAGPEPQLSPTPTQKPEDSPSPTQARISPPAEVNNAVAVAQNRFGIDLFQDLLTTDTNKNVFISPTSIALALYMTYNGSDGDTKTAMAQTLGVDNIDIGELNRAGKKLIELLENADPEVEIAIANSIWGREGVSFTPQFLETNREYYNAEVATLDFSAPAAADTINTWVSENTRNKIPTIIDPPIPAEMVMYLINAVYFKGTWTTEFDKELTEDKEFSTVNGRVKNVPMMRQDGDYDYLENDLFQAARLPYGENERLGMYIFVPKNGLDEFISGLSAESWDSWLSQFENMEGTIELPRFKIEYKKRLNTILSNLGMSIAFDKGSADFSKIRPKNDLFISEVLHKTFVEVNEEGTEAAAVTSVGIGIKSVREKFFLQANKPFFFAIHDNSTNTILFMGTVLDPTAQ